MRLYFFRTTPDIPIDGMREVAETVGKVLNVDYSVFAEPVAGSVEQTYIEDLLRISDQFLERGEPVVAIAFTREGIADDEAILGQGSEQSRGAWVKWNDNLKQIVITTLHELGHVCEADHCGNQSCVMFHTYRVHNGRPLKELLCENCVLTVTNSWVYTRLVNAFKDRTEKNKVLPKVVDSTSRAPTATNPRRPTPVQPTPRPESITNTSPTAIPFPDWSLALANHDEFVRRVMEHFGYRR